MAKLVLSSGGTVLHQHFIDQARITIGRGAHNHIVINDAAMSREHAAIVTVGDDRIVEDLDSSNGTFVNGSRISRRILQHRDVIEFGAFNLCYLNTKAAAEIDLERTMLIAALPRAAGEAAGSAGDDSLSMAATRPLKTRSPCARIKRLTGPGAPETIELDRVVRTFGTPGEQLAVITRRPHGYFITHVEGRQQPRVNRKPIGAEAWALRDGDVIEVAAEQLEFSLDAPAA